MNHIRALRLHYLLSPREFAIRIGIYPYYVPRLESGDRELNAAWIDAIAKGLGVHDSCIVEADFPIETLDKNNLPAPRRFACPIAVRYVILALVGKLGGMGQAEDLSEDQLADAIIGFNAFVSADGGDMGGEELWLNRLSKGLQITVLTILQSCQIETGPDFEQWLKTAVPPSVKMVTAFSRPPPGADVPES